MTGSIIRAFKAVGTAFHLKSKRISAQEVDSHLAHYDQTKVTRITPNPSMHTVELSPKRKVTTSMCSTPSFATFTCGDDVVTCLVKLGHSVNSIIDLAEKEREKVEVESVCSSSASSVVEEEEEGSVVWVGDNALVDDSAALGYAVEAVNFDGSASTLDNSEARLSALFADFESDSKSSRSSMNSLLSFEEETVDTDAFVGTAVEPLRFVRRSGGPF